MEIYRENNRGKALLCQTYDDLGKAIYGTYGYLDFEAIHDLPALYFGLAMQFSMRKATSWNCVLNHSYSAAFSFIMDISEDNEEVLNKLDVSSHEFFKIETVDLQEMKAGFQHVHFGIEVFLELQGIDCFRFIYKGDHPNLIGQAFSPWFNVYNLMSEFR